MSSSATRSLISKSVRNAGPSIRPFSSTSSCSFAKVKNEMVVDFPKLFAFDDTTTLGYLRLEKIKEVRTLIDKLKEDKETLQKSRQKFKAPLNAPIRITQTVDLAFDDLPVSRKRVLEVSVDSLNLGSEEAIQRFKVIAGPRWTPGPPGPGTYLKADGNGWIKISEERFGDARMNRKSVSDMLERLVGAAKDPNSPIPADTPIDTRHLQARKRRHEQAGVKSFVREQVIARRPHIVGGILGYPTEWLTEEDQKKTFKPSGLWHGDVRKASAQFGQSAQSASLVPPPTEPQQIEEGAASSQ